MSNREYLDFLLVSGKFEIESIRDKDKYSNKAHEMIENIKNSDLNIVELLRVCLESNFVSIDYISICNYIVKSFDTIKSKECLMIIKDLFYVGCNVLSIFQEDALIKKLKNIIYSDLIYNELEKELKKLKIFYFHDLFLVISNDISYHAINEHDKNGIKCFNLEDETYDIIESDIRALIVKRKELSFIKDAKEIDKEALSADKDVLCIVIANDI